MLYEKQSPLLPSYYSRRWNATRHANVRTRLIIILGLVGIMLTSLLLLNHFTTRSPPRSNLHGLKTLKELETLDISQNGKFSPIKPPPERQEDYDDGSSGLPKVANATLDFGKIFVLNLETREDRHDEMALIAAATGLEFTYVPGVDSKALETQAMPDTYGTENIILKPGHLACYRGHANIWQRIVEEGIDTALILEDDVDWDLNIREIVPNVKEGMTRITGADNPFSNTPAWDLLYLGTCYEEFFTPEEFDEQDRDEYVVELPQDKENLDPALYDWVSELLENYFNDTTPRRVIVKGKNPVCTHGYAVTQRAARRLLLEMNDWLPFPIDITMIHYISEERLRAYSVQPPLFVQWRNTKDPRRNSDIEGDGVELTRNWGILRSARKNLVDWVTSGVQGHRWWDGKVLRTE